MADNHMKKYLAEKVEEATKTEAFENEIKQTLRTEERFVNYFKQFDPESVESFIEYYAQQKAYWKHCVKNYWHQRENRESEWYKLAIIAISIIAGKKVFNQINQWLTREASYDDIDVSLEWDLWLYYPLHFKDAETITQSEIDAYINYIVSLGDHEELPYYQHLFFGTIMFVNEQLEKGEKEEKEKIKEDEEDEDDELEHYNSWCRYYDNIFQTPFLRKIPIDRYEKECFYASYIENLEKEKNPPPPATPFTYPKYLHYEEQQSLIKRYVKENETYENKTAFDGLCWWDNRNVFTERVEATVYQLDEAEEYVAVTPNEDWRSGLKIARERYRRSKLIEALPAAYDEYLYRIEHQLGFDDWMPFKRNVEYENNYIRQYKEKILAARKLLNEPENFDY